MIYPAYNIIRYFINATDYAKINKFSIWSILTHAWHESGGFNYVIGNYNFWGIKKPRNWTGKSIIITTHEYINKEKQKVKAEFIDFESIEDALIWYCEFIKRLYPNAYMFRDVPEKYFEGLINGELKYATDPKYVNKLIAVYKQIIKDEQVKKMVFEKHILAKILNKKEKKKNICEKTLDFLKNIIYNKNRKN